jgi:hypothetical protein
MNKFYENIYEESKWYWVLIKKEVEVRVYSNYHSPIVLKIN